MTPPSRRPCVDCGRSITVDEIHVLIDDVSGEMEHVCEGCARCSRCRALVGKRFPSLDGRSVCDGCLTPPERRALA